MRRPTGSWPAKNERASVSLTTQTVAALEAGADCLDVTVLGIGERNGIASLSGLIAQLYLHYPQLLAAYDLTQLAPLDHFVAACLNLTIPFNMPITAPGAFTHRAGVHTKAVLRNRTVTASPGTRATVGRIHTVPGPCRVTAPSIQRHSMESR